MNVEGVGKIDPYDPYLHLDAASRIEPRLNQLPREVAEQRRGLVGIIPYGGIDWVFVNVDNLPIEIREDGKDLLMGERYRPKPGAYLVTEQRWADYQICLAADTEGHLFLSAMRQLNARGDAVAAEVSTVLKAKGFRHQPGEAPFSKTEGVFLQAALFNGIAEGLALDYLPPLPAIGTFRLRSFTGKVVANMTYEPDPSRIVF